MSKFDKYLNERDDVKKIQDDIKILDKKVKLFINAKQELDNLRTSARGSLIIIKNNLKDLDDKETYKIKKELSRYDKILYSL